MSVGSIDSSGQHTPGPWRCQYDRWPSRRRGGQWTVVAEHAGVVARTYMRDEADANARLIAASPEMYGALGSIAEAADALIELVTPGTKARQIAEHIALAARQARERAVQP